MINIQTFINKWRGKECESTGNPYGPFHDQCADLANQWRIENGWPSWPPTVSDMKDFYRKAGKNYAWTWNRPWNSPPVGALVVWDLGKVRHIAVVVKAGVMSLVTFDQNWPVGAHCQVITHNYKGCLGWLVRR
jgi:hypothetical protein